MLWDGFCGSLQKPENDDKVHYEKYYCGNNIVLDMYDNMLLNISNKK